MGPICQSPDLIERVLAFEIVTDTDPRQCKDAFVEALTSGERSLRLRAILGLAALDDGEMVPRLVTILEEDNDPDLRAAAARALGEIGDIRASVSLYEAIKSPFPPVREQAVLALLAIGDQNIGADLHDKLENDHDPGKEESLRLLALLPDPSLLPLLAPYLEHDSLSIRTLAASAIFGILERSAAASD